MEGRGHIPRVRRWVFIPGKRWEKLVPVNSIRPCVIRNACRRTLGREIHECASAKVFRIRSSRRQSTHVPMIPARGVSGIRLCGAATHHADDNQTHMACRLVNLPPISDVRYARIWVVHHYLDHAAKTVSTVSATTEATYLTG